MKRFQEYMTEQEDKDLQNLISRIKKDCKPYLRQIKKCNVFTPGMVDIRALYRGIKGFDSDWYRKRKVRQDRRPRDSNLKMTQYIDFAFNRKFGWKPRSQGLFAFNMYSHRVHFFGTPTIVFPVGDFQFVWSKKHSDLVRIGYDEFFDLDQAYELADEYTDKNFCRYLHDTAGTSGREIMIKCLYYYAVGAGYLFKKYPIDDKNMGQYDKFLNDLLT